MKKTNIVWFLENSVRKLSNDRTLRVMQSASITERKQNIIKKVERRKVQIGEWCVFKEEDGLNFFVGRVLLFALLNNAKKSRSIWEDDGTPSKIGALCSWYTFEKNRRALTGKLVESFQFTHGFISMDRYVCSLPSPKFVVSNDNGCKFLSLTKSTMDQLSNFI